MTLFSYDHCPYCVKARMIFGLKDVSFELVTLANDDEVNPVRMIGKKMLPILELEENIFLPESLDIISKIDGCTEFGKSIVQGSKNSTELSQWFNDARNYQYQLAMPRWIQMGLEEFKTQSAKDYFTKKKELMVGSFSSNIAKSQDYINRANEHLKVLGKLKNSSTYFWSEDLSIDDFHVFATLRVLTTTKGIVFPDNINKYMNSLSQKSKVPLHWDKAI